MLIAGGDVSGTLLGIINLATSTNSTNAAEIYLAGTDGFMSVGNMMNSREASSVAVVLPNNEKTLIAGGSHCFPMSYTGSTTTSPNACGGGTFTGFQCDALPTAELYNEAGGGTFALAGANNTGVPPEGPANQMTASRSGGTATLIEGSGTPLDGKVLITGGSTGSTFLGLNNSGGAPPPGCGAAGQVAQNTAEIYDPVADTFTATGSIPGCMAGHAPPVTAPATCPTGATCDCTTGLPAVCTNGVLTAITSATASGGTVTVTDTTNPAGLIMGAGVTIQGLTPNNFNGLFVVSSIGTGTFSYTDAAATTGPASGNGFSAANTFQCGLVDSSAALLGNGDVLVTGGDYLQFLGTSSPQAFIFTPGTSAATSTFTQVPPMHFPRELAGITPLNSGRVLVAGGALGASGVCIQEGAAPGSISVTTNQTGEIFDPSTVPPSWTLAGNMMSVKRIATAELFTTGVAGMEHLAIMAGGVNVEVGDPTTTPPTCAAITSLVQTAESATDMFDETLNSNAGGFEATGALKQAREGYAEAFLNSGGHSGDLAVFGGACTESAGIFFGIQSFVIGTSSASSCTPVSSPSDYYEFFSPGATPPSTGTWTLGTGGVPATPANAPAYTRLP